MTRRAARLALVWIALLFALSCGGGRNAGLPPSSRPLSRSLVLRTEDGSAEGRTPSGVFAAMRRGDKAASVVEVRATGPGAALEIVDGDKSIGTLWIRTTATLAFGEDSTGRIQVALTSGSARYRSLAATPEVLALTAAGPVPLAGRDVLLSRRASDTALADVSTHLGDASWSLSLQSQPEAAGIGTLEAHEVAVEGPKPQETETADAGPSPKPNVAAPRVLLRLDRLEVKARVEGDMIETSVAHTFHNDGDRRLEGSFRFPMPEGAILYGLAMDIDGKLMEGELVEQSKAKKIYQEIVDKMQDPALLEWEQGRVFKLRVFPIEPKSDKLVVLRYLAPARRAAGAPVSLPGMVEGAEWVYPTAAPDMQGSIKSFRVMLGDKVIVERTDFVPRGEIVVPLPAMVAGATFRESRPDGVYTALRVRPDWSKVPAAPASTTSAPRWLTLVVDTSRSTLEERPLLLQALRMVLSELRPGDRFRMVTADVDARVHGDAFAAPTAVSVDAAAESVRAIEPDGASDLGAALRQAGALVREAKKADPSVIADVVYLGDGTATWGETDPVALRKLAAEALGGAPLHAMVLGASADAELLRAITDETGGRVAAPRTELEARRFALAFSHAPYTKRLAAVRVEAGEGAEVYPARATTLFEGDELSVVVRTPGTGAPPTTLSLVAPGFAQILPLGTVHPGGAAARRWAVQRIMALEGEGDTKKDEVIRTSLDFGVMSHHTSFLVLESEEAYARYGIERRAKKNDGAPLVTGGDLESVGPRHASMDPDHLQPGDPEVRIFAPEDAKSVTVVLPFGETKVARWEPAIRAWTVRFLVDKDTPDGTYDLLVRVTHHDGSVEVQKLEYVVDTKKPNVDVWLTATPGKPGSFDVHATQVLSAEEVEGALPPERRTGSLEVDRKKFAHILTDAKRVEVKLPDGQVMSLNGIRLGEFRSTWTPSTAPSFPAKLHVLVVDRALNQRELDLSVSPK